MQHRKQVLSEIKLYFQSKQSEPGRIEQRINELKQNIEKIQLNCKTHVETLYVKFRDLEDKIRCSQDTKSVQIGLDVKPILKKDENIILVQPEAVNEKSNRVVLHSKVSNVSENVVPKFCKYRNPIFQGKF